MPIRIHPLVLLSYVLVTASITSPMSYSQPCPMFAKACEQAGMPAEFNPSISMSPYCGGDNVFVSFIECIMWADEEKVGGPGQTARYSAAYFPCIERPSDPYVWRGEAWGDTDYDGFGDVLVSSCGFLAVDPCWR
jgi:hypothetical protein